MVARTGARTGAASGALLLFAALGCSFTPPPPPGPKVPVSFRISDPGPHKVSVVGPGRAEQSCDLPCSMEVPSGHAIVAGTGAHTWTLGAVIPAEPSEIEIKIGSGRTRRLVGLILGGIFTAGATASVSAGATAGTPDALMKGGITAVVLGSLGLVGLIVGLTAEGDSVRIATGAAMGKAAPTPVATPPAQPTAPAPGVCKSRFDCTGGKVCSLGMCVAPSCVADSDCPKGQGCSLEGKCEGAAGPAPKAAACRSHLDCKGGLVCPKGECVKPACVADKDCPARHGCSLEGQCEPAR